MKAARAAAVLAVAIFGRAYDRAAVGPASPRLAGLPSASRVQTAISRPVRSGTRAPRPVAQGQAVFARSAPWQPSRPLPMLPSIGRVRVEPGRDRVLVTEDVTLPRGSWESGGVDLYVAYGAPGAPIALDAHFVAVPSGSIEARLDDPGVRLTADAALRRPAWVRTALGRSQMAGVVVRVPEIELRRAYASSDLAIVRIRSLATIGGPDASGARDVVVRLGVDEGAPMTLNRIQIAARAGAPKIVRAEANLCGPEADPWPLSLAVSPRPDPPTSVDARRAIVPSAALRHASDDLCIRWVELTAAAAHL